MSSRLVMSADAYDVKASNINMQATVLMTAVRSVAGSISLLKPRLIAIPIAVSVGLATVVSPITVVGIRRATIAAVAVSVTVPAVVTMMNSVATVMPATGFRGRGNETESDNKCHKSEKTRHGADPSWEVERVDAVGPRLPQVARRVPNGKYRRFLPKLGLRRTRIDNSPCLPDDDSVVAKCVASGKAVPIIPVKPSLQSERVIRPA